MISRVAMLKVFLNSFFIQSAWSFEKMQGLGFAAAIAPAIKDIYKDTDSVSSAIKRHMVFYNAHPYMASPILGAVIRMEEEVRDGKRAAEEVVFFKQSLMGPYGAIGDTFFWGAVRPLASVVGVLSAFIWGLWAPVVFLAAYNIFHIWMRWSGLHNGYRLGEDVVEYIKSLKLPERALNIRAIASGLLGILVAALIFRLSATGMFGMHPGKTVQLFLAAIFMAAAVMFLSILLRKGISVSLAVYMLFLPALVFFIVMDILQRI